MATPETTSAPFDFVLIKVRLNSRKIDDLNQAGIRIVERTNTRQLALRAEHEAQRGTRHYIRLGERMNVAGQTLGDSGVCRIKFNPDESKKSGKPADPSKAMTLEHVGNDLLAIGYVLTDVHIMRRPDEPNGMGFLVLVLQLGESSMAVTQELLDLINAYVDAYYRSAFVWENPDGSATINVNHTVVGKELEVVTDRRTLRFAYSEGDRTNWESAKT